jgi:nucleoid DNA-binding protein
MSREEMIMEIARATVIANNLVDKVFDEMMEEMNSGLIEEPFNPDGDEDVEIVKVIGTLRRALDIVEARHTK